VGGWDDFELFVVYFVVYSYGWKGGLFLMVSSCVRDKGSYGEKVIVK